MKMPQLTQEFRDLLRNNSAIPFLPITTPDGVRNVAYDKEANRFYVVSTPSADDVSSIIIKPAQLYVMSSRGYLLLTGSDTRVAIAKALMAHNIIKGGDGVSVKMRTNEAVHDVELGDGRVVSVLCRIKEGTQFPESVLAEIEQSYELMQKHIKQINEGKLEAVKKWLVDNAGKRGADTAKALPLEVEALTKAVTLKWENSLASRIKNEGIANFSNAGNIKRYIDD